MSSERLRRVLVGAALAVVVSCSVPTDESAVLIDPEELPESLRPDFTTTTTTTIAAPETETAIVYLLQTAPETERRLVAEVEREVRRGGTIEDVLGTLFGPEAVATEEEREAGYSNALFDLALLSAEIDGETAVVDIVPLTPEGEPSEEPFTGDLIGAAAQIVFSATVEEGVTGVRIHFNGEEVVIPTSAGDADAEAVLTRDDYSRFDPDNPDVASTTSTVGTAEEESSDTEADG